MSLTTSLIAYLKLDESSGNASDATGNGYTFTNTGSVPYAAAKINNGASFNGNGAGTTGGSLNNNSVLGATSYPRTFQTWYKPSDVTGSDKAIIALGDGTTEYYALKTRSSDSNIVFRSNNSGSAGDVDTGITAVVGTWYHCVIVQNSATSVTIYINNVQTNNAATTFTASVSQMYLGYLGRSSVWYNNGLVDEVGVWNRGLSSTEVGQLYNGGAGLAYPFASTSSRPSLLLNLID